MPSITSDLGFVGELTYARSAKRNLRTPSEKLPSSMEAVRAQKSDVPHDSEKPLFAFGHGLTY